MYKDMDIRLIKPLANWGYEYYDNQLVADSKARARAALEILKEQQVSLNKMLTTELAQQAPSEKRVNRLNHILDNIAQTLRANQR